MKVCPHCGEGKSLDSFGVDSRRPDGRKSACRECLRKQFNDWEARNGNKERRRVDAKVWRSNHLEQAQKQARESRARHLEKCKADGLRYYYENRPLLLRIQRPAHHAVKKALRDGTLIQQPCEVCGSLKSEAHHDDYSKPLEVRWLCHAHHQQEHEKIASPMALAVAVLTAKEGDIQYRDRRPDFRGEGSTSAKLTWLEVCMIRLGHFVGMTQTVLAKRYGITQGSVWHIINYRQWKEPPETEEYIAAMYEEAA